MPKKYKNSEDTSRVTNSGIYVSGGQIEQSDYDTLDMTTLMQDYTDMRNDDSIASSSIDILIYPILNSNLKIEAGFTEGNEPTPMALEVAEYVQDVYDNLYCGINYYKRHKLLALYYGFSMFEKVWERGVEYKGKYNNTLVDMYPIQQDTIFRFEYDETATFTGIKQEQRIPEKGFRYIDINADSLHVYTPFEEYKNIQGRSMLRPSRLVWKIKKQIWIASGRASSRGAGIPEFIFTPTGNKDIDSTIKSSLETIGRNIGNSENAYIISQKDVTEFKLHTLQNQEMNIELIRQANTEMFYNTLSEFVTSGIGGNGSRAATGEHKAPFYETIDAIIKSFEDNEDKLIEEIVNNSYYAGRLEEEEMPYCNIERPKEMDVVAIGNLLNQLISSRTLTKNTELELYIRDMLGLPEITEDEIKQQKIDNQALIPQFAEKKEEENTEGLQEDKTTEEAEKVEGLHKLSSEEGKWITINGNHILIDDENDINIYNEAKESKTLDEFIKKQFDKKPKYGMGHRPTWEGMPPSHDLLEGDVIPRDVYEHPEFSIASGRNIKTDKSAKESWDALQKIRNNPEMEVTVYRAARKNKLNTGDWVTFSKTYAEDSVEINTPEKVYEFVVKAKDVIFAGDDINEFGYYPKDKYIKIWENVKKDKKLSHDHNHCLSKDDDIFELKSAQETIINSENKAEETVNSVYEKIIDDIAFKLEKNPNNEIKPAYKKEMLDKLSSIYNTAYKVGMIDVRKEYAKIKGTELARLTPIKVEGSEVKLAAKIDTLYSAIENSIKNELLLINKQNIENAGGMKQYIMSRFGETQKQLKSDLVAIASGGYISGRNNELTELESKDKNLKRLYLTSLEKRGSVCDVCRPLDFITMDREQAEYLGLEFDGHPINPLCLGGNNCNCIWRPAYTI